MGKPQKSLVCKWRLHNAAVAVILVLVITSSLQLAFAQKDAEPGLQISRENWGRVTAPVYGTAEAGAFAGAELIAGPDKFGTYYSGVLPNGRIVTPAGISVQVGMNPLGFAITPDGKFLVTSNDDERETGMPSLKNSVNKPAYSLSVLDATSMQMVSQINTVDRYFVGLQITGAGPYTVWASGGADHDVKLYTIAANGTSIALSSKIAISPISPQNAGYASNYVATLPSGTNTPSGFNNKGQMTFPAGSALSPDQKFLYIACNADNSVAVIDTAQLKVVQQIPVGYFPYAVSVSHSGQRVLVSNWGISEYKLKNPQYDANGKLVGIAPLANNLPDGFYVPVTSVAGSNPKTSSISILNASSANGASLALQGSIYEGHALDELYNVGDTHPSAVAIVRRGEVEVLYVTKSNSDSIGLIRIGPKRVEKLEDFELSPIQIHDSDNEKRGNDDHPSNTVHGAYPNAIVVSPHGDRAYVAEAGINSVAVLDTTSPEEPRLIGRIPTGWYPTAVTLSSDGRTLFIANAKGVGEDINPATNPGSTNPPSTGLASFAGVDSNYIFGTVQKVDLSSYSFEKQRRVMRNNFAIQPRLDTNIVPVGGKASKKIKHVFFILHENKTFDSMLGNLGDHFGVFASTTFNTLTGTPYTNGQYTGVSLNTQVLAKAFAAAVNYYSDSEESDAGHQFSASGTATDYTEKTLLVKSGRGLLVNKNFEPEDYPEGGYIFNNAARNGVGFKDYGALLRIEGTDTGTSKPTSLNDVNSGLLGYPTLKADKFSITQPLVNAGDVTSPTQGLGQSYFMALPVVAVLGGSNSNGEARLDRNYPGYNFNISDQRRAKEFMQDFDRMVQMDTLPEFIYIYQPNDHTGGVQAPNAAAVGNSPLQQIADGDVGLGMVVKHIMESPVYYNSKTGEGSAIFMTYDDAQSSLDHIHPHRTPLIVISPYAKPGYIAKRHYSTASVVKTEELLLGLPPNNLGDLFATDLRDMFQPEYNGITTGPLQFDFGTVAKYQSSPDGKRIWALVSKLDTTAPDRDSRRLGALIRLTLAADNRYRQAKGRKKLHSRSYRTQQAQLYRTALQVVQLPALRDLDD